MRRFVETHFGFVLILSCIIGLAVPGIGRLPDQSAIAILAALTFVACYRLKDGGLAGLRWSHIIVFYLLRFALLPIGLWLLAREFFPSYAIGVLLLSMLPSAISSPAFAHIYGGAVAPAFAITVLSQVASPFIIPLQFSLVEGVEVGPSPAALFQTLVWCIFIPMVLYALVRKHKQSSDYIYQRGKYFSILLVGMVITLVVAKQREVILAHPQAMVAAFLVTFGCYIIYILFGWLAAYRYPRDERITVTTCSGFNNAAMGVSLALMHFPPDVILFVAASEISWALLPTLFRILLGRRIASA